MSSLSKAQEAWGEDSLPDWVEALANACDRSSQNRVAQKLERSASLVSCVLGKSYSGNMKAVEEIVRGTLMHETIRCPGLGDIEKQVCRKWRGRAAEPLDPINSQYVQMHRACHRCTIFMEEQE